MAKRNNSSWAFMVLLGSAAGAAAYLGYFQERIGPNPPLSVRPAAVAAAAPPRQSARQATAPNPVSNPVYAAPANAAPSPSSPAPKPEDLNRARQALSENPGLAEIYALEKVTANNNGEAAVALQILEDLASKAKEQAAALVAKGEHWQARNAYSQAYFASQDMSQRAALAKTLDKLNAKLIFSSKGGPDTRVVKVVSGDSLGKIAQREKIAWRAIKRVNNIRGTTIRLGQKLRLLKGQVKIEICVRKFELTLTHDGHYLKRWIIGIGKDDRTPIGTFTIAERLEKPVWYSPEGVFPFGHEKNVLGTRWLGFNRSAEIDGFGIHGTKFPESVGTKASMGCIRMRNEDVEYLFDFIPFGCEVRIR